MKILVPLVALLLSGGMASAQEKGRKQEMYHVSWTDKHGKQKCHNGASKVQAERNAAQKRTKKGVSQVMVDAGKCERSGAEGRPGQVGKPRPSGQKPQVGKPTSHGRDEQRDVMRKVKEKKESEAKKDKAEKQKKKKKKEEKEKDEKKD